MSEPKPPRAALRRVRARRISTEGTTAKAVDEEVAVIAEAPLSIDVDGIESYTLLCTPDDARALAVGFLCSEGIIDSLDDVASIQPCADDASILRVRLRADGPPRIDDETRNLLIVSSCGLCGARDLGKKLAALPEVPDTLRVPCHQLRAANDALGDRQPCFRATGGCHAVGIFDAAGTLLSWAEDAGRHNALDKAIGKCLLEGRSPAGCGAVLSGRASLEMVAKCARAGIELLSAISAPTSLAIEVAEQCGITLCAFVRQSRATLFSHPHRVLLPAAP